MKETKEKLFDIDLKKSFTIDDNSGNLDKITKEIEISKDHLARRFCELHPPSLNQTFRVVRNPDDLEDLYQLGRAINILEELKNNRMAYLIVLEALLTPTGW